MKVLNPFFVPVLALLLSFNLVQAATITFNAAGDGTSWEDPLNWDTETVPTAADDVIITGVDQVVVNDPGAVARTVLIEDFAKLTIAAAGDLTVDEDKTGGDAVIVDNSARLTNNGTLTITNTAENCMEMDGSTVFTNNGTFIASFSDSDLFNLADEARIINKGDMTLSESESDGMDINSGVSVLNDGNMFLVNIEDEGINMDGSSSFINNGLYSVDGIDGNDGICIDDNNTSFENNGQVIITNVINGGEGLEVDDGVFTNTETGTVLITEVTGDVLNIESGGEVINHGKIDLFGNDASNLIELEDGGVLTNFNLINVTEVSTGLIDTSGVEIDAIELEGATSRLNNDLCGVINILSNHPISIDVAGGTINNQGVIGTVFDGTNVNNGTFQNDGQIVAPNGFDIAPNALEGIGEVDLNGAVPASGFCLTTGSIDCDGITVQDPFEQTAEQTAFDCVYGPPFNSDALTFGFQELCGDGEVIARLDAIQGFGFAGLSMRENVAPGSKKVQITRNQTNYIRREVRNVTNGSAFPQTLLSVNTPWMRITRAGNVFSGYTSRNGVTWKFVFAATVQMADCIQVGIVTTNFTIPGTTTADFSNISITGSNGFPAIVAGSAPALALEMEQPRAGIAIYPNPTAGQVSIALDGAVEGEVNVEVFSALGQKMQTFILNAVERTATEIDLSNLPTGVYYLHFLQEDGTVSIEKLTIASE